MESRIRQPTSPCADQELALVCFGTAICGIPLVLLPFEQQQRFVAAVEAVAPGKGFLLYSYCVTSPLPYGKLGLRARREAWTPLNFPPASVWRYQPRR